MSVDLSEEEIEDLIEAIGNASEELCYDPDDPNRYPEAYALHQRWDALSAKLFYILYPEDLSRGAKQ